MPSQAARAARGPFHQVELDGVAYECGPDESILDAVLRQGAAVPYSCRKGTCLTCLMRCVSGSPDVPSQTGLKDSLRAAGYFLACQWRPTNDIAAISASREDLFIPAEVTGIAPLSPSVRQVLLRPLLSFDFHAGQFINLRTPSGLVRSYSLASLPRTGILELHVRRYDNGQMSGWIFDSLRLGDRVEIQGPNGASFYISGKSEQPLLLIGTGTGLAPLLGVVRDALANRHTGEIRLYHGSRTRWGLYFDQELCDVMRQHPNFTFIPCVSRDDPDDRFRRARAEAAAFTDLPSLTGWRVFLCGNPSMVTTAKKSAYLAGARLQDIYTDPFELRDLRSRQRTVGISP